MKKIIFHNILILFMFFSSFLIVTSKVLVIKKNLIEEKKIDEVISNSKSVNNNYFAVLEIPKIKLKKGLVSINSKNNDVDKNIEIILWNSEKKLIVLAAHSGNGYNSYFKDLYKLDVGDISNIYYNNKTYNYLVTSIFTEIKDGDIEIYEDYNSLILTTCYGKDKQLIVILKEKVF